MTSPARDRFPSIAPASPESARRCARHPRFHIGARRTRGKRAGNYSFIYRITNPTMREMFIGPSNELRMKEASLSLLAGDIFGRTPIWGALRCFKGAYGRLCLANIGRSLRAMRRRADKIRPLEAASSSG